jgi:protein ImuB
MSRFASIWFPYLLAEYAARQKPELRSIPFVLASPERGRMVVQSVNALAMQKGIRTGMVLADCKAIFPELEMHNAKPGQAEKLLHALAEWAVRYTPFAAIDSPDGLLLDTSGCTHLWGGEIAYLEHIKAKLNAYGYTVKIAMADTIGAAWAMARFGNESIVKPAQQRDALKHLPATALRLDPAILERLKKLGLERIGSFIDMPPTTLRRRFGPSLAFRIRQALGQEIEFATPVKPVEPYQERLCSMEPIATAVGITIALQQLLDTLCARLESEGLGLRHAVFTAYRVDGALQQIEIGTGHASRNVAHLFKLFEHKIATFQPDLGFELFVIEAPKVEAVTNEQAAIWNVLGDSDRKVAEFLDRVSVRIGPNVISRYLPAEHYLPERAIRKAQPLWEKAQTQWQQDWPRPIHLLLSPEPIEVTAVVPDYPPILFLYKGKRHAVAKSDGPERIEQEWWLSDGLYRDYYCVEDENGARYWLFRSGPYNAGQPKWFIHGFFA